jgi:hypothetical protein
LLDYISISEKTWVAKREEIAKFWAGVKL